MTKKKILLRLDSELHFRSLNAQIEFLLKKALKKEGEE
jgi:hypothetical protein